MTTGTPPPLLRGSLGPQPGTAPTSPPRLGPSLGPPALYQDFGVDTAPQARGTVGPKAPFLVGVLLLLAALALLVVLLIGGGGEPAAAEGFTQQEQIELVAGADIATVRLAARACPGVTRGSGFVVDGLLLTAGHLVEFDDVVKVDRPGRPVLAPVLATSRSNDLAVIEAAGLVARPLTLSAREMVVGAPVLLAGHPGGEDFATVSATVVGYQPASSWGMPGTQVLLIDEPTEGGFSGGPVLDRDGDVVGMLVGWDKTTGLTVAIPGEELLALTALASPTWGSSAPEDASISAHSAASCGD